MTPTTAPSLVKTSLNAVKCNLTEFTAMSVCFPLVVRIFCSVAAHCPGSPPLTPFPPSFHCFSSVTGACSSYCMGAHGWVARIYPAMDLFFVLELVANSGSSWMSHLTSILVMQLIINNYSPRWRWLVVDIYQATNILKQ